MGRRLPLAEPTSKTQWTSLETPIRDSSGKRSYRRDSFRQQWWEGGEARRGHARNSIGLRGNTWRRPLLMLLIVGGLEAQSASCSSRESSSSRVPQPGQRAVPGRWAGPLRGQEGWQRKGGAESCTALSGSGMVRGMDEVAFFREEILPRMRGGGEEDGDGDYEAERAAKLRKNQVRTTSSYCFCRRSLRPP